ncbi:kinase-like protein [Piedraia hortae CBS 480.64]|uniref:non-specific serine/threonine protein kinase n=1 Tax=Piedraia hortae CBS 480.64 TaxID=1314780 RepID=A0A6A7BNN7_9PEZI|nr:kinase-like protein [Piedraia hortae CBS 480.64]
MLQKHRNIIPLQEFWENGPRGQPIWTAVFECCTGGDLQRFITHWERKHPAWIPSLFVKHYVASMAGAMGYLHKGILDINFPNEVVSGHGRIIHRDIKPANIFLRWNSSERDVLPDLVLGDFGLVCQERDSATPMGTPGHKPPECKLADSMPIEQIVRTTFLTARSDMYCFGAVLWSVITSQQFDNRRHIYIPTQMVKDISGLTISREPAVMYLLAASLRDNPAERPSTTELVAIGAKMQQQVKYLTGVLGLRMPPDSYAQDII